MTQYIWKDDLGNEVSVPRLCKVILELPGTVDISIERNGKYRFECLRMMNEEAPPRWYTQHI